MKIEKIEVWALKILKAPVYLGDFEHIPENKDYYVRSSYRSVYSKNLESLLVKITTDHGISGLGEALAPVVPEVSGHIIKNLFEPLLIGENPLNIELIGQTLYNTMRERGHFSGFMVDAISAVDIALWDLFGKLVKLPIYQLLGGAVRKQIPAYVSGLPTNKDDERIALALSWKKKGFQAIKLHLGVSVEKDVRIVGQLREALGDDMKLMVDAHWKYTVSEAIQLGKQLEKLDVKWLEAPTLPEDVEGTAAVTRSLDMDVAIGEAKRTRFQFKERLLRRAADIYQPDIGRAGITETRKIANLADAFHIPIAPHLSTGLGIVTAATLHVSAAITNFVMLEYQPTVFPVSNRMLIEPLQCENGFYSLPEGPGLGVHINDSFIREYSQEI